MSRARSIGLLLLVGCGGGAGERSPDATLSEVSAPVATDAQAGRSWRRMNIDQLEASIKAVTGGIGWHEDQDGEDVDLFVALDGTLGKPDYLSATEEDLSAGLLFQKFLDDAAKSACGELMDVEPSRGASERALLVEVSLEDTPARDPEAIEANMRAALLRFHGRAIAAGDPALDPWLGLLDGVYDATGSMSDAWETVCVGLITHPDFYSY